MYSDLASEIQTSADALMALDTVTSVCALIDDLLQARSSGDVSLSDSGASGLSMLMEHCRSVTSIAGQTLAASIRTAEEKAAEGEEHGGSYKLGYIDGFAVGATGHDKPAGAEATTEFISGMRIGFLGGWWEASGLTGADKPPVDGDALNAMITRYVNTCAVKPAGFEGAAPDLTEPVPEDERDTPEQQQRRKA